MLKWKKQSFTLQNLEQKSKDVFTEKGSTKGVFKGLILALLSGLLYSSTTVIVKYLDNLDPGQLCLIRYIAIFAFNLPEAIKCRHNFFGPPNLRVLVTIRSIFATTHIQLSYFAFRYLPLGEANVILFSIPAFVTVAARIFLKEPCGLFQSVSVILTMIGLFFTAKIPSYLSGVPIIHSDEYTIGLICAFIGIILDSVQIILLRKTKEVHYTVLITNMGIIAIIELSSITAIIGSFKWNYCGTQRLIIIVLGIFSYLAQAFIVRAYQCEFAGPISTVRAGSDIGLAFLWQTFFFKNIPDTYSIIGAALVVASIFTVGLMNWVSIIPRDSPKYKYLKWMLK